MIKLLMVSSDSNIGGAGKCIKILTEALNPKEFQVHVVVPEGSLLKELITCVPVIECPHIGEKSLSAKGIFAIGKIIKELQPQIVHSHASMSARIATRLFNYRPAGRTCCDRGEREGIEIPSRSDYRPAGRTCCDRGERKEIENSSRSGKAKIIYTRHSVFEPAKIISWGLGKAINGFVNNYFSDGIIAVAQAAKENLVATGVDPNKIKVILNGIPPMEAITEQEKKEARKSFGINDNAKIISIVARLTHVKGHKYFIEAAELLKDCNLKFIIAGTGPCQEELMEQAKQLGVSDNIIFTGFLSDVTQLMNITDIQVNCSYGTEATGISLLEGMSLGKPAIVTDFGGNTGVIKHMGNGLVVAVKQPEALAEGIRRLINDEALYKRLSKEAIEVFKRKFTAQINASNTEEYYKQVLGYRQ